jgi:hypothetical protein
MRAAVAILPPIVLAAGCPRHEGPEDVDVVGSLLAQADAAWEARGEGGLDPIVAALDPAFAAAPGDPEVLWRLARVHTALGLAAEDDRTSLTEYATARSLGLRCLDLGAALQRHEGADATEEALAVRISRAELPCAAWTALAWAKWIAQFGGEAAAIDIDAVDLVVARAEDLRGDERDAVVEWAKGVLLATRPEADGRDLEAAEKVLEKAIRDGAPAEHAVRADLILLVAVPGQDDALETEQRRAIEARPARYPEEKRAVERLGARSR